MGLLDSNKISEIQKNGSFSCDLTSTSAQNAIDFGTSSFATIVLNVSGITSSGSEIKVYGAVVSGAKVLTVKDANGVTATITSDGTYYVPCIGITDIYFKVSNAAQSGSCTVRWALSPKVYSFLIEEDVKLILQKIKKQSYLNAAETFSFVSVSSFKVIDFTSDELLDYRCLCINVTAITSGASFYAYSSVDTSAKLIIYNSYGKLLTDITEKGIYYVPVPSPSSISLRNTALADSSATIRLSYFKSLPNDVLNLKPVQIIKSNIVNLTSSSRTQVINFTDTENIKYFKYYYLTYQVFNNSAAATRNIVIEVQPYHKNSSGGRETGKNNQVYEDASSYTGQTEWLEVNATNGIRVYVTCSDYQEGDSISINFYGIR